MSDHDAGREYVRKGGDTSNMGHVSQDFRDGVSYEQRRQNQTRLNHLTGAEAGQSSGPSPSSINPGIGGGFSGLLAVIGVIFLFIHMSYGFILIGAAMAVALLPLSGEILRSKSVWVIVAIVAFIYFYGHTPHH